MTDVAAEDLQDPGHRHLAGQLGWVVCLEVPGQAPAAPHLAVTTAVSQVGALVEHCGEPVVVVAADFALGWLPDAHTLVGADGSVRLVGPQLRQRDRNTHSCVSR